MNETTNEHINERVQDETKRKVTQMNKQPKKNE